MLHARTNDEWNSVGFARLLTPHAPYFEVYLEVALSSLCFRLGPLKLLLLLVELGLQLKKLSLIHI